MNIQILDVKPMGGVELIVDGVFQCPVFIEGDYEPACPARRGRDFYDAEPASDAEFTVNEVWACIDEADWRERLSSERAIEMLFDAGFFEDDGFFQAIAEY